MQNIALGAMVLALLLNGAIFGFFYAWSCSIMPGLDRCPSLNAIVAMQNANDAVQNAFFFPAFFLSGFASLLCAAINRFGGQGTAAVFFLIATTSYICGGMMVTFAKNIPMNNRLAKVDVSALSDTEATRIWADYSPAWQRWNLVRTVSSGAALLFCGLALIWTVQ